MKLFGKKKKQQTDKTAVTIQPDASLTFETLEKDVIPQEQAEQLVLSFEGMEPRREEEKLQALRGATKTLPDQKEIARAVAEQNSGTQSPELPEIAGDFEIMEEPGIAEEPVNTEEPEITEELVIDEEPEIPEEPGIAEEPVNVEEPEIAEEPEIVDEPETVEEPEIVEEPGIAEEPVNVEEPEIAVEPVNVEEPEIAVEPVNIEEPGIEEEAETPQEAEEAPEQPEEQTLSAVSYESMAQAVVNAKKEPTGRFSRDAIDDDTLLAELYALIGDTTPKKAPVAPEPPEPETVQPAPIPRPITRITQEALQDAPDTVELEEDNSGTPGWLKGAFILLISLLLSAMTLYAVATDVVGKIF